MSVCPLSPSQNGHVVGLQAALEHQAMKSAGQNCARSANTAELLKCQRVQDDFQASNFSFYVFLCQELLHPVTQPVTQVGIVVQGW